MSSRLPLFRDAVYAARSVTGSGAPINVMPASWRTLTAFAVTLSVCAIWFLATQRVVRRETAPGILTLSLGELRVVPAHGGILTDVYVHDGEAVQANQRLAYVSTTQFLGNGGGMEAEVLGAMSREQSALKTQLDALDASAPKQRAGQRSHLLAEKRKLEELRRLLPSKEQHLELAQRTYEQGTEFQAKGALSGDGLRARHYEWLTQQSEMQTLKAQIAELEGEIGRDAASLEELPEQQAKQHAELLSQLAMLQQKQLNTSGQEGYLISARVSGHVTALQARVGQYVDPSRPLMTLAPLDSSLQAELYVPSKAIAFARRGQRVRLMYDAFPHQQFGVSYGTIREMSATVLKPDEIGAAVALKEPAYRVIVAPDKIAVMAYGVDVPLRSGMALSADLVLEDRSFLQLLLDPLLAAKGRILAGEDQRAY